MSAKIIERHPLFFAPSNLPETEFDILRTIKENLPGQSRWVSEARALVASHAAHHNPLILSGEPGTGKKHLARLIHDCSERRKEPFVSISFGEVSEESLDAVLFGTIKTLPSGRFYTYKGLVEKAAGGTLYIEGVLNFPPVLRAKISRLIHLHEFTRYQDQLADSADVRVIIGHTREPSSENGDTVFAELSLSINDVILLPPLRNRRDDIEALSKYFLKECCASGGKELRELARDTSTLLRSYDWPGNVRELKRVIEHAVMRSTPPPIETDLLPEYLQQPSAFNGYSIPQSGIDFNEAVKQFEIAAIKAALKQCRGIQAQAAQMLGLKPTTLNAKIKLYEINPEDLRKLDE